MTYDCQLIEDLLPLYVEGSLSEVGRDLVDKHLETCPDCQDLFQLLQEEKVEDSTTPVTYDVPVTQFSKKIKRHRRWVKIFVVLALILMTLVGSVITLFLINPPFDYVSADLGDYGRSSKQITTYLEEARLPSFLPRSAEDISLTFKENESLVNGKFHLPIERSLQIQKELTIATVDDLKLSQEAIPGDYNGVKQTLETAPEGASYYQDDQFVYVFMTDGTVYYYGK